MSKADGPQTQQYCEVSEGVRTHARKIVRAGVAHFLVEAIQDPSYIHKSVGLAEYRQKNVMIPPLKVRRS